MASYEMEDDAPQAESQGKKKISFRFCRECSNMLYPREDHINNKLMFNCRMCNYSENADVTCIYRNALKEEIAETAGNTDDVEDDPTVGADDDDELPDYNYDSAMDMEDVYAKEEVPEMCTLCGKEILCPTCGRPSANMIALETDDPDDAEDVQTEEEKVEDERRERALSGAGLLPRTNTEQCPKCGERNAVFFQSQQRTAETGMALFFKGSGQAPITSPATSPTKRDTRADSRVIDQHTQERITNDVVVSSPMDSDSPEETSESGVSSPMASEQ
ncbi:DNA-directed RNA polymerase II core subunit rpb9 [Friedmanniomyces endolithicus]|uniref:DNA-directed RNA polymerase II subunit RPB9 n=1 Tax=Friedmanniomyces endolithicus TaxID=329885 RepID=A0AAN6H9P3_9PEZI|nr:DNA-directed RNA polymerase II core subunit rpb9 [Friedmanniomyces endolithicus]KAK0807774.1 DNA-directed RNA polymerase II core subunit rpb9 [Friedmanniomyces endolithicus]KAK0840171.1 DNA-directed RNA polymerase II core subunit rpb9 [Friedmanniomyces endolithicus]KAK0849160.1 DNA-directed RNA polymerase II core subunit rpb9 [Friedmanniomyces endolithicus]KAK0882802.1 DNA-directed RNA polymerase II core subunit rpb9 [Friedmanniomyces endolithicus]